MLSDGPLAALESCGLSKAAKQFSQDTVKIRAQRSTAWLTTTTSERRRALSRIRRRSICHTHSSVPRTRRTMSERPTDVGSASAGLGRRADLPLDLGPSRAAQPAVGMGRGNPEAGVGLLLLLRRREQRSLPGAPRPIVCGRPKAARPGADSATSPSQQPRVERPNAPGTSPKLDDGVPRSPLVPGRGLQCEPVIGMGRGNPDAGLRLLRFLRREQRGFG
ncbi:uncharacterized protein LOC142557810 [Dermacentor variabilis]|uniref:uncharacterized protein LOC142557810 n=1 Tax=Dermacentor variabilis TaxID=34621 RepID=UPI003F5B9726